MAKIDLSQYYNQRNDGSTEITADQWNTMLRSIEASINAGSSGGSVPADFYVNGEKKAPVNGVVQLASKGSYVLSGTLNGRVVIGTAEDTFSTTADEPTQVFLNGVMIVTNSTENSALSYEPEGEKMIVTLCKNKKNIIVCSHEAAMADSQDGSLNCENNLVVQGSGYLTIVNKGGHGIKASTIRLSGNPHIYVEAEHDGIHGNKILNIEGGVYYVNKANDAFGTRAAVPAEEKEAGTINIFGGEFYAYNIRQNVFDSKSSNGVILCSETVVNIKNTPAVPNLEITGIVLHTDVTYDKQYNGIFPVTPDEYFESALVSGVEPDENGVYTIDAKDTEVNVHGYLNNAKFVFKGTGASIVLNGAYIGSDVEIISYTAGSSNVKVKVEKDTFNIIKSKSEDAIVSANNIVFEPKSGGVLLVYGNVKGSEIYVRDGNGSVLVKEGNIEGSQIVIGDASKDTFGPFGGAISAERIIARPSGKGQKGNFNVTASKFLGCVTANTIGSSGMGNLGNSKSVFYHTAIGSTFMGDTGKTYEPFAAIPYDNEINYVIPEI